MVTPSFYHSSPGNPHFEYLPTSTKACALGCKQLSDETLSVDFFKAFRRLLHMYTKVQYIRGSICTAECPDPGEDTVPLSFTYHLPIRHLCTCMWPLSLVFPTQALPEKFHECFSLQPWSWPEPLVTHPRVLPNGPTREALAVHPPGPASPSSSAAGGRSARRSARVPHTTSLVSVAGPGCAQRAQRLFPGLIFPRFLPSGPPQGHPGENRSPSQPQPWVCFQLLFPACTHSP